MIARKTFGEIWLITVIYVVVLEIILLPAIHLWPDLYDFSQKSPVPGKIPAFIKEIWQAVRDPSPGNAYRNYFAVQAFFKGVNICGLTTAMLMGVGIISRERENQTFEFLVSRPVSRSKILFSKFWVMAVCLVVPIFITSWSAIPLSQWEVEEHLPFWNVTVAAFHNSLFVLGFLALTCLCSILCRIQSHTAAVAGTFLIIQLCIYFIPTLRAYSLFKLSDFDIYGPVMMGNISFAQLFWQKGVYLLGATGLLYLACDLWLRRLEP